MVASSWTHLCTVVLSSDSPLLVPLLLLRGNTSQMSCLLQVLIYALPWRKPKWRKFFILRSRNCSLPILPKARLCNFHCHSSILCVCVCVSAQLCPTLCDPMVCSLPCSSVHGIFQARILEWIAFSTPQGEDVAYVSCIGRQILYPHHLGSPNLSSTHPITLLLHLYIPASIHFCSLPPNNLHIFIGLFQVDPYYTFK